MTGNGLHTAFTHDDWGRTVTRQLDLGESTLTTTYQYMYGDKLKRVDSDFRGEAALVQFNYDGFGERRNKEVDGETLTWYRWEKSGTVPSDHALRVGDGTVPDFCYEYARESGSWTVGDRQRTYALVGMLALAETPGTNPSTGAYRYYAQDHLGSLRALFDGDKAWAGTAEYEPYGMPRTGAGPAELPGQLFTGKTLDLETMLYYFPFRYYSPLSARWMTRDPLGFVDGTNLYTYVGEDPVFFIDDTGGSLVPGHLKIGGRCDKDKLEDCTYMPEDNWPRDPVTNEPKPLPCPDPGTDVEADALYTSSGRIKIRGGALCILNCNYWTGAPTSVTCLGPTKECDSNFPDNPHGPNRLPPHSGDWVWDPPVIYRY